MHQLSINAFLNVCGGQTDGATDGPLDTDPTSEDAKPFANLVEALKQCISNDKTGMCNYKVEQSLHSFYVLVTEALPEAATDEL